MKMNTRIGQALGVGALAVGLALGGVTPANAAASTGTSLECNGSQCVTGTAALANAGQRDLGGAVAFNCTITAPGAAAVAVTSCTAGPFAAPRLSLPGEAVTTVGAGTVDTTGRMQICWSGSATFVLGGQTVLTSGCSFLNVGTEVPPIKGE